MEHGTNERSNLQESPRLEASKDLLSLLREGRERGEKEGYVSSQDVRAYFRNKRQGTAQ